MKKRLKIGLFVDTFFPMVDGVVIVVDNYAKILSKDHDVVVFCPKADDKDYTIDRPYKIVRSHKIKVPLTDYDFSLPDMDSMFDRELRFCNLDIVHIHSPFSIGRKGMKYAMKHRIPLLATFHSQYWKDFFKATKSTTLSNFALKQIMTVFNKSDLGYGVNRKIKELYEKEYKSTTYNLVRNNGTDMEYFDDHEALLELKKQYGIKEEKVLLFVGRLDRLKNIFFIVDVLEQLKAKDFQFKMLFVGSGVDEEELKMIVKEQGLNEQVIFTGRIMGRENLAKHYGIADMFMFPSLYDASSLVQIEAASQKTPTIFIKGAVTADTVEDGFTGYLAPSNIKGFTEYLMEIFANNEKHMEVSENAYNYLYKTWSEQVAETVQDYYRLIELKKKK